MNIIDLLEKKSAGASANYLENPFIDYNGRRLEYADILERCGKIASAIEGYGFVRGAVVALVCYNHINFILYFTACLKAGVVPLIINSKYSFDEFQAVIKAAEVKAVITDNIYVFNGILAFDGIGLAVINPEIPPKISFISEGSDGARHRLYSDILSDGTLFMLITSASGGRPKIVKKNAAALKYQADNLYPLIRCHNTATRYFTNVPPSHSYGLEFAVLGSIYNGVPLFIRDFNFSGDALSEIAYNSITHMFSIPPFILNLTDYKIASGIGFDSLEMVISAGMPLLAGLSEKFYGAFGFNIASVYGITEAGCVSFNLSHKNDPDACASINNDVGGPLSGNEVLVLSGNGCVMPAASADLDSKLTPNDTDALAGNIGRIVVRKKIPDGGYYKLGVSPDDEYLLKWRAGFCEFETDDSGYIDSRGALHLIARSSAFVNIGGSKVNTQDIEAFLRSMRLFEDVLVFGTKDDYLGEKIAAALVVNDKFSMNGAQVRALCVDKLPFIKVPREVYILKKPFPRTASGKIRFDKVMELIRNERAG